MKRFLDGGLFRWWSLAFIIVFVVMHQPLQAQDTLRFRYGLYGGVSYNGYIADFTALPNIPNCCPRFQSGSGSGPLGGLLLEYPLGGNFLFGIRGGYASHDGSLTEREAVRVIVDGIGRDGAFEHRIDASVSSVGIEPSVGYRLFGDAFLQLGLRAGFMSSRQFFQEERIFDPSDRGTFLDSLGEDTGDRFRNQFTGDLPETSTYLFEGIVGISWELPLNNRGTLLLVPEISYAHSFNNIVRTLDWKSNELRAGFALKISPRKRPEKPIAYDTVVVRDTVEVSIPWDATPHITRLDRAQATTTSEESDTIRQRTTFTEHYQREVRKPPPMTCSVTASGVDESGVASPIATLRIEEFLSTIAHPLLNYVFFEPNAATIPERYTRLTSATVGGFHPERLQGAGTLPVYYTMLNIIGQRMRKYPNATLTLTGCNMDAAEEKGNLDLSRGRAESVRDYLVGVWGIEARRLRIDAVNLPEKKSNPLTPDGQAEDRRVEIASSIPEILDVLVIDDTVRTSSPPIVRLHPVITSATGVREWRVRIAQNGVVLKEFSGSGTPPADIDWDLVNDQRSVPRYDGPLEITMTATNPESETSDCRMALPTEVNTVSRKRQNRSGDYTIDRYNLILFNVGESGITAANQRVIKLVKGRLKPSSQLTIEGFADRSGNAQSNQRLSAKRASMTADGLGRPDAITRGIGESRLLYTNDLPEGRFYCRTVQIEVKTRVEE